MAEIEKYQFKEFSFIKKQDIVLPPEEEESLAGESEVAEAETEPPPAPLFDEATIQEACEMAREEGMIEGRAAAEASQQQTTNQLLEQITHQLTSLLNSADTHENTALAAAGDLLTAAIPVILPSLARRFGQAEIRQIIHEILASKSEAAKLNITLHPTDREVLAGSLTELINHSGFEGKCPVFSDPDFAIGDIRVDWGEGGLERDSDYLVECISRALADAFATLYPESHSDQGVQSS